MFSCQLQALIVPDVGASDMNGCKCFDDDPVLSALRSAAEPRGSTNERRTDTPALADVVHVVGRQQEAIESLATALAAERERVRELERRIAAMEASAGHVMVPEAVASPHTTDGRASWW